MKVEGTRDGGMAPLLIREDPDKRQLLQTQPLVEVVGFSCHTMLFFQHSVFSLSLSLKFGFLTAE